MRYIPTTSKFIRTFLQQEQELLKCTEKEINKSQMGRVKQFCRTSKFQESFFLENIYQPDEIKQTFYFPFENRKQK